VGTLFSVGRALLNWDNTKNSTLFFLFFYFILFSVVHREKRKKKYYWMPVTHLVLLKFKAGAQVDSCMAELARLKSLIPGLLSFSGGANTSKEGLSRGFTHAFSMVFESTNARDAYLPHPEHERVKELLLACLEPEGVVVVDYAF